MTGHVPDLDASFSSREPRWSTTSLGSMGCLHRRPPGARARSEALRTACGTALGERARAGLPRRIGPEMRRTPPRARILALNWPTCARTSRVSVRRSQNPGWCVSTRRAPMHRLHRSVPDGRPHPGVRCEYPPTWGGSTRNLHRGGPGGRLRLDHVEGIGARFIESPQVVDHMGSFGALDARYAQCSVSSEPVMKSRSSWRVCTESLLYTERRCVRTVFLEIERFSAIHVALLPCANSSMTSSSRAERP
jgi:hypothetical protein